MIADRTYKAVSFLAARVKSRLRFAAARAVATAASKVERPGEMMRVTPPRVSRAISSLEERLGARLFHRSTRQFSLTDVAERFYEGCCRILDDLDGLEADAASRSREPTGVLRLVAHTTAMLTWLVPLISSFKRKHPKVALDVTLTERPATWLPTATMSVSC